MPESRDRLVREEPFTPNLGRRSVSGIWQDFGSERSSSSYSSPSRFSSGGGGGSGRNLFGSPLQSAATRSISGGSAIRPMELSGSRSVLMRRGVRNLYRTPLGGMGSVTFMGSNRRRRGPLRNNSPLPGWYPRTPLRDITGVVNAYERRRTHLREVEQHRPANPSEEQSSEIETATSAPLEHEFSTPNPVVAFKALPQAAHCLPKIFLPTADESEFLTPQKKLLNSIDQIEKVVMEEFRRMKRTPSAKKAERARKVRTLMAMR